MKMWLRLCFKPPKLNSKHLKITKHHEIPVDTSVSSSCAPYSFQTCSLCKLLLKTDFSSHSHRALHGQRAEWVPSEDEGLAEERPGDSVWAWRGQQPADGEAEAQGENRGGTFTLQC